MKAFNRSITGKIIQLFCNLLSKHHNLLSFYETYFVRSVCPYNYVVTILRNHLFNIEGLVKVYCFKTIMMFFMGLAINRCYYACIVSNTKYVWFLWQNKLNPNCRPVFSLKVLYKYCHKNSRMFTFKIINKNNMQ